MNEDLIDDMLKFTNKFEDETAHYAVLRLAGIVEFAMSEMEKRGEPITRDTLHKAIKDLMEKYDKLEAA